MPPPRLVFNETEIRSWHAAGLTAREIANTLRCAETTLLKYTMGLGLRFKRGRATGPRHNLNGLRVGKLMVLRPTAEKEYGEFLWLCTCDCGKEVLIRSGALVRKRNPVRSCGCLRGETTKAMYGGGYRLISASYWHSLVKGAARRDLEFAITKEYAWSLFEFQKGVCAISGVPISLVTAAERSRGKQTASLDRINADAGYIHGNVQWVHKVINRMKWDMAEAEFLRWCAIIIAHQRG